MSNFVEKWNAFCEWQRWPSRIPKKSPEWHRCPTCGEEYQGNYCPCCGQSAKIGRYSFKNALLLFLDVWGMGNRGMFRTLRDLVLRPYTKGTVPFVYPFCVCAGIFVPLQSNK